MEILIPILLFFIVVNTILKISFWKGWQIVVYGIICGGFVLRARQWAVLQSKTRISEYLTDQTLLQNGAVLVTIEAVLFISYCFLALSSLRSKKQKRQFRALHSYPGLLIFPVLFYILTQSIFSFPGTDFAVISQIMAGAVLLLLPLVGYTMRRLLPENEFRLEVLFLVSCVVLVLGLLSTVSGQVIYAPSPMSSDLKAITGTFLLFAAVFAAGFILNKFRWNTKRKHQ